MTVSKLLLSSKKYKTALFRRRIIERLRLEMVSEQQVLAQLDISRLYSTNGIGPINATNARGGLSQPASPVLP